ncbi:MAG: hypothetical protein MZW92_53360 [Comamonadaceae bacterium]|nr:hypothetical protein [Comamonadaceae bacterium]
MPDADCARRRPLVAPGRTVIDPFTRQPFPGNVIPREPHLPDRAAESSTCSPRRTGRAAGRELPEQRAVLREPRDQAHGPRWTTGSPDGGPADGDATATA